jgi:restriction system protein
MTDTPHIKGYRAYLWECLQALEQLGGSGHKREISTRAIEIGPFSEEQKAAMQPGGRMSKLEFKFDWCLTALKAVGYVDNSGGGVWALTDKGRALTQEDMGRVRSEINAYYKAVKERRKEAAAANAGDGPVEDSPEESAESTDWKPDLLARIKEMDPAAFERLCQRLLREAGFEKVEVTGRSGDGGIDGVGLARLGLLSFPTYFQCKRYQGSVGSGPVRDFRGAMAGRGEKGVIITSGTFTPAARAEATRDGVPPIDLIDGDALCDLLKRHRVGINVTERIVEDISVDNAWWQQQT